MGCKWSSLNGPDTESCHSHSILELGDSPFHIISPLGKVVKILPVNRVNR